MLTGISLRMERLLPLATLLAALSAIAAAMFGGVIDTAAAALLAALCVALAAGWRIASGRTVEAGAPSGMDQDVFGPVAPSPRDEERLIQRLAAGRPHLGNRLRRQATLRRQLHRALSSGDEALAVRAMADAEATWDSLASDALRYSVAERVPLEETMAAARRVFPSALALNAAQLARDRGDGPDQGSVEAARRVLLRHRDARGVNRPLLERALAALERGESLPRAPWVSLSTGTVGSRVCGMGRRRGAEATAPPGQAPAVPPRTVRELDELMQMADRDTDALVQHGVLSRIVELTYRYRAAEDHRALFYRYAWKHVDAASRLLAALQDAGRATRNVPAFQYLARVLAEDGQYAQALEVCRRAIELGLEDGTASGFHGRLARIEQRHQHGLTGVAR